MNDSNGAGGVCAKLLQRAEFVQSVPRPEQLPADEGIEVAFAGRSNTGKSSAINILCSQRSLARTSRTPGRTQHLVVFGLDSDRRLIDLPGFGYAKVSKTMRAHWEKTLPRYLEQRRALTGMVLLMDIRHPLKPIEITLIDWCMRADVQLHVLLNKADKLSRGAASAEYQKVRNHLSQVHPTASVQLFSALKRDGLEQAWQVLAQWLEVTAED